MIKLKVIRMFNIARVERAVQKIRESNTHTAHRQKRSRGSKHVVDMCIYIVFLALFIVIYLTPDSDQDNFLLGNAVSIIIMNSIPPFLLDGKRLKKNHTT